MASTLFKITVVQYWLHDCWIDAEGRPCDLDVPGARFVERRDLLPTVRKLRAKVLSLQGIADELNDQGHTTRRGKLWNPVQVARVLQVADA
jgi:hypothetical protein